SSLHNSISSTVSSNLGLVIKHSHKGNSKELFQRALSTSSKLQNRQQLQQNRLNELRGDSNKHLVPSQLSGALVFVRCCFSILFCEHNTKRDIFLLCFLSH